MYFSNTTDEQRADRICERREQLLIKHPEWSVTKAEGVAITEVDLADEVGRNDY